MSRKELFTISELAKRSGTNTATIKHYVNEGLLAPVKKTGRTMAWYDEESVKRVQLIRSLKEDRFLPLSVIKRLISGGGLTDVSVELDHAIYPAPESPLEDRTYTTDEMSRETGLSAEWIQELVNADILHPLDQHGRLFSELDAKIAQIIKQREDDGLSLRYSREVLKQYSVAIKSAVYRDIRLFISMVLRDPQISDPLGLFNRDDDSVNLFLFYARRKFNRRFVDETLGDLEKFTQGIRKWIVIPPAELLTHFEPHYAPGPELEALRDITALLEESDADAPDARNGTPRPGPLSHLAEVIRRVTAFSRSGALDHRLHNLLSELEAIDDYGSIPSDKVAAGGQAFLETLLAAWITGAIYLALPSILGHRRRGIEILEGVMAALEQRSESDALGQFIQLLEAQVVPTVRRRLAEVYAKEEHHG